MDTKVLNEFLGSHKHFVFIARRGNGVDNQESEPEKERLQQIEMHRDGRLILHVCKPTDPTIQRVLGQCALGNDTFVTIRKDPDGKNTFWLSDSGWKVTGINLPQWDEIAVA